MRRGLHPRAGIVEDWPAPNYINPERHAHDVTIASLICGIAATIVLFIRLTVRLGSTRNFGSDDALAIAAYVVGIGLAVTCCLGEQLYGFDLHEWDVTPSQAYNGRTVSVIVEILFVVSTSLIKLSILVFFCRLTAGLLQRIYSILIGASIAVVVAQMIGPGIAIFFQCTPLEAYWRQSDPVWLMNHPNAVCVDEGVFLMTISVLSVFTDLLVALLPSILFWRLEIDIRQKLAFIMVFIFGLVLCIIGAVRIWLVWRLYHQTRDTWDSNPLFALSASEPLVGFIVSSLPTLKIFFARILPDFFSRGYTYGSQGADDIEMQEPQSPDGTTVGNTTLAASEEKTGAINKVVDHRKSFESTTLGMDRDRKPKRPRSLCKRGAPPGLTTWFEDGDSDDGRR